MADKEKYMIKVEGKLVEVTPEVYYAYFRMERQERGQEEKKAYNKVMSYDALDDEEKKAIDIDIDEFLNRVFEKAKAQGDYCLAGPMNYLPFDSVRNGMDCFEKLLHFAWQKEWRIAYIHDQEKLKRLAEEDSLRTYEEPYTLQIGDISDIAEIA